MEKRAFLKTGSTLLVGGALFSLCKPDSKPIPPKSPVTRYNWAKNLKYSTNNLLEPSDKQQLKQHILKYDRIRPLGTAHCFNHIADSKFNQVSIRSFDRVVQINQNEQTASVDAGASYGQVCKILDQNGFALPNLASLPHISVAGAMATATHGSGVKNGNLGSAVSAIEFIDAQGESQFLSKTKDDEIFNGIITHLGCLGVITSIQLDLQPRFEVKQWVYQHLPVPNLLDNFKEIMSGGYSVSLFTDYQQDTVNQVWVKSKVDSEGAVVDLDYFGASLASRNLHPITELSATNCTEQMGVAGPWYDRLPHFKMEFTPSSGKELQSEFFVPLDKAPEAFEVISSLKEALKPVLMISEIRAIAADNQWMSPFYKQDSIAFHFTWEQDKQGVEKVLPLIQNGLEPFGVKPHWGKVFSISPDRIQSMYPELPRFKQVVARYDPKGKFRNEFLNKLLYS